MLLVNAGLMNAQCPTISGPSTMTVGTSYNFSVTSGSAQCTDCYDWDIVSGSASITGSDQNNTFTITPTAAGSVQVCVNYITESGCVNCCKTVTAEPACNIASVNFAFNKVSPNSYWLAASPNNASYTYSWTVTYSDGTVLNYTGLNVYNVEVCHNDFGLVSITLTVTSAGCPGGKSKTVNYNQFPDNCSGRRAGVSPNPVHDMLHLQLDDPIDYTVTLHDTNGNLLKTFTRKDGKHLNISDLKKGIYIVRITDGERKEISTDKIVKE